MHDAIADQSCWVVQAAGDAETPAESDRQDEDLLKKRDMPGSASLAAASQPVVMHFNH